MRDFIYVLIGFVGLFLLGCKEETPSELGNNDIEKVLQHVTQTMVHDVTNPPLAARFFAYINLAGDAVLASQDSSYAGMQGILNEYSALSAPKVQLQNVQMTALLAMIATAQKIQPSGYMMEAFEQQFLDSCRQLGYREETLQQAQQYAGQISEQILAYAKADHYQKTTNYPKYTPKETAGHWYPTPPAYFAAVEPYFNTIRPFTIDSASQFKPAPPAPFSEDKDSPYFKLLREVYDEVQHLPNDHRTIASFWDCNPFAMADRGHLMIGLKKISPGAHWMGITSIACRKANRDFATSMRIHTVVSVGMMDAFLSCWDEKYRSNRIRPETAIRKYIDPSWEPLLQTPPFPEYPSGHSTVSAACATILTHFFGDDFAFTDDVEVPYGIPSKDFPSFMVAAKEAAISRLYGGIHYRDANENGIQQGLEVGQWVVDKVDQTALQPLASSTQIR